MVNSRVFYLFIYFALGTYIDFNTARIFNISTLLHSGSATHSLDADSVRIPNGCVQQKKIAI